MARTKSPNAYDVFQKNMNDAHVLLDYARALRNVRKNALRSEMAIALATRCAFQRETATVWMGCKATWCS